MTKIGDRTNYCTDVTENDIGKTVTVKGWAAKHSLRTFSAKAKSFILDASKTT